MKSMTRVLRPLCFGCRGSRSLLVLMLGIILVISQMAIPTLAMKGQRKVDGAGRGTPGTTVELKAGAVVDVALPAANGHHQKDAVVETHDDAATEIGTYPTPPSRGQRRSKGSKVVEPTLPPFFPVPSSSSSGSSTSSSSSSSSTTDSSSAAGPTLPPFFPVPSSSSSGPSSTSTSSSSSGGGSSSSSSSSTSYSTSGSAWSGSGSSKDKDWHNFFFYNSGLDMLWVAILGNPGFPVLADGGFVMGPMGPPVLLQIPLGWQGRVWARVGCNFSTNGTCNPPYQPCCMSGSCLQSDGTFGMACRESGIAPTSLIEFSLDSPSPYGPYDVYDISLVDGWSVPMSVLPLNGTYNLDPDPGVTAPWCEFTGCDAAPPCPSHLAVEGTTLACWSPCQAAVNQKERHHLIDRECCVCTQSHPNCDCKTTNDPWSSHYHCCDGGFGCTPFHTPPYAADTVCNPWSNSTRRAWPTDDLDYIKVIEKTCKKVYSWQFDDKAATFMCRKTGGAVDYQITFVTRLREEPPK